MKKVWWFLVLFMAAIVLSCEKDDPTEISTDRVLKYASQQFVPASQMLQKTYADYKAALYDSTAVGKCNIMVYQQGVMPDGTEWAKVDVKANTTTGTMTACAISLVIDYDETCCTLLPLDASTLHPGIQYAIQTTGAVVSNVNNGEFYFAFYSITPVTIVLQGNYRLFQLIIYGDFTDAEMTFDQSQSSNCEFTPDGWYIYPVTFTGTNL